MDPGTDERRAAFERIARAAAEPVRRYPRRRTDPDTADDILSETLTALWRRVQDVPQECLPWVIRIAKCQLADVRRTRRRTDRPCGSPSDSPGTSATR